MAGPTAIDFEHFGLYDAYYLRAPDFKAIPSGSRESRMALRPYRRCPRIFIINSTLRAVPPMGWGYAAMTDDAFVKAIYANVLNGSGTDVPAQAGSGLLGQLFEDE